MKGEKETKKEKEEKMVKERQTHNQTTHVNCGCVDFIEAKTEHGKWTENEAEYWILALLVSSYGKGKRKE